MQNHHHQPPSTSNPTAILPIRKQEHVAFLHDMFNTPAGEVIKISRRTFVGRFISSLRNHSEKPQKTEVPDKWHSVEVEFLPSENHPNYEREFNYFEMDHSIQINDFVKASFDLFFHVYFFDLSNMPKVGMEEVSQEELTKLHLVDSFIAGLNLVDVGSANETVKKREYRREIEILTQKRQCLIQKERRFRLEIYQKRKKYIQSIINKPLKK